MSQNRFIILILAFVASGSEGVNAQGGAKAEALESVQKILPLICGSFPQGGSAQKVEIKGEAKATINGLLKKLADLGIEGAADFSSEEYVGVLRSEIGAELKSVRDCNQKVYADFSKIIAVGSSGDVTINNQSPDNVNIVNGSGNTVVKK
ncbi:hypothetical protein HFC70_24370 [Agrobacterium sp. a22-2]|uniref:hypothetical protein n=1 Tax=Agrobacterium sp. a22-2 TaxID=2283840 RepID=UPI001444EA6C|nr:hypothetical protein [Agrobacterium sp. a22-2]NKN39487.1 hypothetical protein [Agrobacterium sp. a22-2]